MICPKCGRPVEEAAVICPGCDFILDTDFLGGDILDEEHQLRPGQGGVDPAVFNLADAVILGNIDDDITSFETSDSGFHIKKDMQAARLYVSGRSQAVMSPDAVIATIANTGNVRLTPFEKHVLRFIDGKRPVESIRRQAGLDEAEVKTALANLADKGVVKVVGRALTDIGDFDIETAPGNAPKSKPRRMRGTLVGAVVVVGDAADQAIDDAFRTLVRAAPLSGLKELQVNDDADVFSGSDDRDDDSDEDSSDGMLEVALDDDDDDDDDDDELFEAGTAEVQVRGGRPPTSSTSAVRPAALREAVNAGRGRTARTGRITNNALSDVDASDASDGFDDFGDASELATAVVAAPSLSEESSLPGVDVGAPKRGVFAEPAPPPPGMGLSELEEFDSPDLDDLADSRVEPRPILPPLPSSPRAAPPALPSLSGGSDAASAERSMNEEELAAFSGGVWEDVGDEPTNVRPPQARPATNARAELSTSLSALLDSNDDDAEPGPTAPQKMPPATVPAKRPRVVIDSAEDNTAFRPPPSPMAVPIGRSSLVVGSASSGRRPFAQPSSVEDSTLQARLLPNPAAVVARATPPASVPAQPLSSTAGERVNAADDLFPDDDDALDDVQLQSTPPVAIKNDSDEAFVPSAPVARTAAPAMRAPAVAARPPAGGQHAAADAVFGDDDEDPNNTGNHKRDQDISAPSADVEDFGTLPTDQVASLRPPASPAFSPPGFSPRHAPAMELTATPSVEAAVDDSSAWSNSAPRRPQPPPPEPSRFDSRVLESISRGPGRPLEGRSGLGHPGHPLKGRSGPGPTSIGVRPDDSMSSSVEVLDSAMVIRPAIKAVPLALAVKKARGAVVAPPPLPVEDDDDFMVDPDATMNLPPLPRSQEDEARKKKPVAPSLAESSGPISIAEPANEEGNPNRRAPTDDMRRKARNLMEQAQQDHATGRLGAARMNAKLATIYDPNNEAYRRILTDWEDRPKAGGADSGVSSAINNRPEYVQLYEAAQDLEDDDDIDGALEMLEKGLRLAPNAAAFHNRIGVILAMRKRDFERASDEIQKAIALEPDNPHYRNNLGKIMAKANKHRPTGSDGR